MIQVPSDAPDSAVSSVPSLTVDGAIARVSLQRPARGNRLEAVDLLVLQQLFSQAEADPGVRVLVLEAQGRHFCTGYDLAGLEGIADAARVEPPVNPFGAFVDAVHRLRKPSIAAIQGGVYGGAIDLALACDFRLGTEKTDMFMPALRIGLQYYASGLERYVQRIGAQHTRRIFLTARTFDAMQMLRIGVLDEVHESEPALRDAVDALARTLAGMAPLPMDATRRAIDEIAAGTLDRARVSQAETACLRSLDLREGLTALKDKRPARFIGR